MKHQILLLLALVYYIIYLKLFFLMVQFDFVNYYYNNYIFDLVSILVLYKKAANLLSRSL